MINFKGRFQACEDLLIACPTFQTWVDSIDETTLRGRVTWPIRAANLSDYPYVNLSPGQAIIRNVTRGFDSCANFQPSGSFVLRVWDRDTNTANPQASFDAFDQNFTDLLTDMVTESHSGPLILNHYEGDDPVIVHSHDNAWLLGEDTETSEAIWMGCVTISWGIC